MSEYVLRTTPFIPDVPSFDVMAVNEKGFGESIAWFWDEDDAEEYRKWKEKKDERNDG